MNDLERRRLEAQSRYTQAQAKEAEARDPVTQGEAKAEQVAAMDEIAAIDAETRRRVAEGRL